MTAHDFQARENVGGHRPPLQCGTFSFMCKGAERFLAALILLFCFWAIPAWADAERVVILKADGLPFELLDSYVRRTDPYTGKSVLPWIDYVFYQHGTRIRNFYSRGLSLSAPSWALLDTGQPSVIKGNLELDRLTLQSYDYMNAFAHVVKNMAGHERPTPGVDVLDEQRLPLLSDAYTPAERRLSVQIYVRGLPTGPGTMKGLFTLQNPKEWLDEWTIGIEKTPIIFEILERDLISKLKNPNVRYFDFLLPVYDHTAHINREPEAALHALQLIDTAVGRVWAAIEKTPLADRTALVLVSDHGMNSDPAIYSQGYNLVGLFTSAAGGGHHVVTNHQPLGEYAFKSLSPVISLVTTTSPNSYYLKGQAGKYPTLLLDADGNERASVYLRNSDLNLLQILLQQLARKDLKPEYRPAATEAFFKVLDRNRESWTALQIELQQEMGALHRLNERSPSDSMKDDESSYGTFLRSFAKLIALQPDGFNPLRIKIDDVLPQNFVGPLNSLNDLQNYVVGLSSEGLVLSDDGSLDMAKSFIHVNYFPLLERLRTQNNPQSAVSSRPVDFTAAPISTGSLPADILPIDNAIWLYRSPEKQALILGRRDGEGKLWLRYLPVRELTQDVDGRIQFSLASWEEKLPLELWESLLIPEDERRVFLDSWHEESEWLNAFHTTRYSVAVISLYEQFAYTPTFRDPGAGQHLTDDELLARFHDRKRRLVQADFIIFANDHWNFNYRGFNPGGNHGAFFRRSTHATLMFAGGRVTGIPEGLAVEQPYDTLSFVPTIFRLTGQTTDEGLSQDLAAKGFKPFPGRVIKELFVEEKP
jgi:Type I phosphodiesterase / nucleotide pyrophosphatase